MSGSNVISENSCLLLVYDELFVGLHDGINNLKIKL